MATGSKQRIIRRAAHRYGIDPAILYGVWGAETNFGRNTNTSSAGAVGPFQFMPDTARGLGIDPYNFRQAAFGAAKYLSRFKGRGVEGMLAAYNAGPAGNPNNPQTRAYVPRVIELSKQWQGGGGGGGSDVSVRRQGGGALIDAAGAGNLPQGSTGLVPLLEALGQEKPQVASGSLPQPAHAAQAAFAGQVPESGGGPAPRPDIGGLLESIRTVGGDVAHAPGVSGGSSGVQSVTQFGGGRPGGGRVVVDPSADRAGAHTHRAVVDFVRQVSAVAGLPIRIGTGTNHSRLTVDGNVSDHWAGNAADIPATGRRLVRLGQAALIAAGMPEREARKQTGGLYNVGGHQIIFATHEGGDHTTHLHVSARRR